MNIGHLLGQRIRVPLSLLDFRIGIIVGTNHFGANSYMERYEIIVEIPVNSSHPTTFDKTFNITDLVRAIEYDQFMQEMI